MRGALLIAFALLAAAPAAGAVVPVSADRLVGAAVLDEDLSESVASSSFGLFDEAVSAEEVILGGPIEFIYDYRADASQTSTIDANGVTAIGQAHIDGLVFMVWCLMGCLPASAASTLEWTFDVASPTHFALSGTLETEVTDPQGMDPIFAGEVTARVRLEDVSGGGATVAEFESVPTSATPCCETVDVVASGTLPAGRYRLVAESWATYPFYLPIPWGSGDASFDLSLALTEISVPVPQGAPALLAAGLLLIGAAALRRSAARRHRG
jgi:hypothetical protein